MSARARRLGSRDALADRTPLTQDVGERASLPEREAEAHVARFTIAGRQHEIAHPREAEQRLGSRAE